jgi:hypothetical protein
MMMTVERYRVIGLTRYQSPNALLYDEMTGILLLYTFAGIAK